MGYTPEEIESKEFTRKFKGFDDVEVRNYLRHVGGVMRSLRDEANDASKAAEGSLIRIAELEALQSEQGQFDALGSHVDDLLRSAQKVREDMQQKAESEAAAIIAEAESEAATVRAESDRTIQVASVKAEEDLAEAARILEEARSGAQAEADEILANAKMEIEELKQAAKIQADQIRSSAEQDASEQRSNLESERESITSEAEAKLADAIAEAEQVLEIAKAEANRIVTESEQELASKTESLESELAVATTLADTKRTEAEEYYQSQKASADEYLEAKRAEADEFYEERKLGVMAEAAEAEAERDRALEEVDQARAQVSELLEQARAQSEFLRQEAEEVIRKKVRVYIDQTEQRLSRLRVTEQSARERLIAAQHELTNALAKVDAEPVETLGAGTADAVLEEARQQLIEVDEATPQEPDLVNAILNQDAPVGDIDLRDDTEVIDLTDAEEFAGDESQPQTRVIELDDDQVPPVEPNLDDPLAQLVREAMQQAVDTAASSEAELE